MNFEKSQVTWQSPSNIALIKYWGKKENQIPLNPSISFTLNKCNTVTTIEFEDSVKFDYDFYFHNKKKPEFIPKLDTFFTRIIEFLPSLNKLSLKINSKNSFPHSSGIASSASAFSSLALCLTEIESFYSDLINDENFSKKASFISRLGSGSASRSIFGELSCWGKTKLYEKSSDFHAMAVKNSNSSFPKFCDTVLIVDSGTKKVSSTLGHKLMDNHIFKNERIVQSNLNFSKLKESIETNNLDLFVDVVENEAMTLHALMMTSNPRFILFKPNTIRIIECIVDYRKKTGNKVCFTLDAGANVHLLYPKNSFTEVQTFIKKSLVNYCHNGMYINDEVGLGPQNLN